MKKTLVILLAFVFVLGIAATAFAAPANPFVDVPAKHWAYGAVSKLAKAGIVDGYGDGTFRGDRTMTRYEMAQIVAKAMAKSDKADAEMKALIDKLAVEFAAELNNLGVRVAKLEAKTNVSWTFESRLRYGGDDNKATDKAQNKAFDMRQRIYLNGVVNDKIDYGARMQTGSMVFGQGQNIDFGFDRMFFNIKDLAGIDKVTIGRFQTLMVGNGLMNGRTWNNDGIMFTSKLGEQTTFKGFLVDVGNASEVANANFDFNLSKDVMFNLGYQTTNLSQVTWPVAVTDLKTKSLDFGVQAKLSGDFWLKGEYVSTKVNNYNGDTTNPTRKAYAVAISNSTTGYFASVTNIVNPMKAHTDAFEIGYRSVEQNATPLMSAFNGMLSFQSPQPNSATTLNTGSGFAQDNNTKGFYFQYQNVLSKGLVFSFDYADLKQKSGLVGAQTVLDKDKIWMGRLEFYF